MAFSARCFTPRRAFERSLNSIRTLLVTLIGPLGLTALLATVPASASFAAWRHFTVRDSISATNVTFVCTTSINKVSQKWPYHDEFVELCIRYWPNKSKNPSSGYDVLLRFEGPGQVVCGGSGCNMRVRYGDEADTAYFAPPSDGSTNALFAAAGWAFAGEIQLANAKAAAKHTSAQTAIEVTVYQRGMQTLMFDTGGLDIDVFKKSGEAPVSSRKMQQ